MCRDRLPRSHHRPCPPDEAARYDGRRRFVRCRISARPASRSPAVGLHALRRDLRGTLDPGGGRNRRSAELEHGLRASATCWWMPLMIGKTPGRSITTLHHPDQPMKKTKEAERPRLLTEERRRAILGLVDRQGSAL